MKKRPSNLFLKAAIIESGKTFAQVAEECGMSETSFSRKVNGFYDFSESEIELISKSVRKNIFDIFFKTKLPNG